VERRGRNGIEERGNDKYNARGKTENGMTEETRDRWWIAKVRAVRDLLESSLSSRHFPLDGF